MLYSKQSNLKFILLSLLVLAGFSVITVFVFAQFTASQVYFSGKLSTAEGEIVADGNYHLRFFIYDSEQSSNPLWEEAFTGSERLPVINGQFQVILGQKTPLTFDFKEKRYWLGIQVGGKEDMPSWDEEMKPRLSITTLEELLLAGKVELSPQEFIEALISEFETQATSTENLTQEAFLKFIQGKLAGATSTAVFISPQTLNLLLEQFIAFQEGKKEEPAVEFQENIFSQLAGFFSRIIETISQKLSQIFERLTEIFARLTKIQEGIDYIISLLQNRNSLLLQERPSSQEPLYNLEDLAQDSGQVIIKKGEISARIFSHLVSTSSRIFVSPAGPIKGLWWISERKEGDSFTVSLLMPPEEDLLLDYWIVAEKKPEDSKQAETPLSEEEMSLQEGEKIEGIIVLSAGATTTQVLLPEIKEGSTIILEFVPPLVENWDILEIVPGQGFTFTIINPALEDINISWAVLNPKEQATSSESQLQLETEPEPGTSTEEFRQEESQPSSGPETETEPEPASQPATATGTGTAPGL